jgi:excisionase family DNA binding protein
VNDPTAQPNDELLTPAEAALVARCSLRTLRRAYASGGLAAYRPPGGRSVRLLRREVVAFFLAEPATAALSKRGRRASASSAARSRPSARDPLSLAAIRAERA